MSAAWQTALALLVLTGCTSPGPRHWYVYEIQVSGGGQWDTDAKPRVASGPFELETACQDARDRAIAADPSKDDSYSCEFKAASELPR